MFHCQFHSCFRRERIIPGFMTSGQLVEEEPSKVVTTDCEKHQKTFIWSQIVIFYKSVRREPMDVKLNMKNSKLTSPQAATTSAEILDLSIDSRSIW